MKKQSKTKTTEETITLPASTFYELVEIISFVGTLEKILEGCPPCVFGVDSEPLRDELDKYTDSLRNALVHTMKQHNPDLKILDKE